MRPPQHHPGEAKQRGAALMVMLIIMVLGAVAILASSLKSSALQIERDKKTADALAQAKEALIGYAVNFNISTGRPGDLPCPDTDNDGVQNSPCGSAAGSNQWSRLGRLPWKTLGLPDLRDGSGERLWYAVSNNFKQQTKTICTNSSLSGCLNSDTTGTITVFGADGNVTNTAGTNTGAVAVIIAPGGALQRQDNVSQTRGCTVGVDCDANDRCTTSPPTNTPKCNPINYLDIATVGSNTRDNKSFTDGLTTDGFIQGQIKDSNGNTIVNDRLLVITQDNIMQPLQKRVAAEVKNCLTEYAAIPQNQGPPPNQGYYPWATARTVNGSTIEYNDSDQLNFGHIPDVPFEQTCSDTGGFNCASTQSGGMKNSWGVACTLTNFNWWVNWKEMVFYGFANAFRPHLHSGSLFNHACSNSTCLVVNPPSTTADKSFVVIVAGEKLPGQTRPSNNWSEYLEGANATGASPFQQSPRSTTFNDTVVFQ